jgi:hypothetical protein
MRFSVRNEVAFIHDIIRGHTQLYIIIYMTKIYVIFPIPPRIMKYNL